MGNVLPEFLSFSEHPFPVPTAGPFSAFELRRDERQVGYAYTQLKDQPIPIPTFALRFVESGRVLLSREVIGMEEVEGGAAWRVRIKDWNKGGGAVVEETWDAVVITIVWFDNPYVSDV
jgi:hypothetical protein